MNKEYILVKQVDPESDVPWIVCMSEHAAATPVICDFFETEDEANVEIERLKK